MKLWFYVLALFILSAPLTALFAGDEGFVRLRGFEITYGAYDIAAAPSISFAGLDFLVVKPIFLRYNPFTYDLSFGAWAEYFPLSQFGVSWFLFGNDAVNPFVFAGLKFLNSFNSVGIPFGAGLQVKVLSNIYFGLKLYLDSYAGVVSSITPNWDISFEYKIP